MGLPFRSTQSFETRNRRLSSTSRLQQMLEASVRCSNSQGTFCHLLACALEQAKIVCMGCWQLQQVALQDAEDVVACHCLHLNKTQQHLALKSQVVSRYAAGPSPKIFLGATGRPDTCPNPEFAFTKRQLYFLCLGHTEAIPGVRSRGVRTVAIHSQRLSNVTVTVGTSA